MRAPLFPALLIAARAYYWPAPPPRRASVATMTSRFERDSQHLDEMVATAKRIARRGCGLMATDESVPTAGKRLEGIGVENTEANRRAWRTLLYTTQGLGEYVSGVIMFDEALYQRTAGGVRFTQLLAEQGILTGVKVDTGLQPLAGTRGETATQGLDGLAERCKQYYAEGVRFAKWRAVYHIGEGTPSQRALEWNAQSLARYASVCQEHGLVPIIEPEVALGVGDYTAEHAAYVAEKVLSHVFRALNEHDVVLEATLLKPSMVLPGLDAPMVDECVPELTARTMLRCVPPAVPGIHFLSGGMGSEEATHNLQALQRECPDAPWSLSFSYGRALQDAVLKAWAGSADNVASAQAQLLALARVNSEAQLGVWDEVHPSPGSQRLGLAKHSFAEERRQPSDLFNW
jgi:fructose-bisphosphate aldolase class I